MAKRVSLTTELDCSPDDAWHHVQTTRLLLHIATPLIRRWDHWITIEPAGDGTRTRYTDTVHVDAGLLTPLIAGFAKVFYAHRQRRWRALAQTGFSALAPIRLRR